MKQAADQHEAHPHHNLSAQLEIARPSDAFLLNALQRLVYLLFASLVIPAFMDWLHFLQQRSWQDNALQVLTGGILLFKLAHGGYTLFTQKQPLAFKQASPMHWILFGTAGLLQLVSRLLAIKTLFWGSTIALVILFLRGFLALPSHTQTETPRCEKGLADFLFALFLLPDLPADIRNTISLPLQHLSTQLTTWGAGLFIPISAQGNIFYIRGEAFEVTVPCSGLHTWLGFLFGGLLWLFFENRPTRKTFLWVLLAAPALALLTNTVRLIITALVAYYQSPDAGSAIHTNLEYILFPCGLLLLFQLLQRQNRPDPHTNQTDPTSISPKYISPLSLSGFLGLILTLLVLNGLMTTTPLSPQQAPSAHTAKVTPLRIPYQLGEWQGQDLPLSHQETAILAPATLTYRAYYPTTTENRQQTAQARKQNQTQEPGQAVEGLDGQAMAWKVVWLQVLSSSTAGALHNFYDSLVASGNQPQVIGMQELPIAGRAPLRVSVIRARNAQGSPLLLLLWYQQGKHSSESRWRWYGQWLWSRLNRHNQEWQVVELATPLDSDTPASQAKALRRLTQFTQQLQQQWPINSNF